MYNGEMGEKGKPNGSRAMERGGMEELKDVKSRQMWAVRVISRDRMMSGPRLWPKAMSWVHGPTSARVHVDRPMLSSNPTLGVWAATCGHVSV